MLWKLLPQRGRGALVKEDSHLRRCKGAKGGVLKDGSRLSQCHAGKPFDELANENAVFKVLEQSCDRHAGSTKYPGSAHAFRDALYCFAGGPIDHDGHGSTGAASDG